jgi:AcrR family transcriptional regulator
MGDLTARLEVPHRADARRNYEKLLAAAEDAFGELGAAAPLEEIAKRAGVGIATLYRNFPTREALFEAVYVHEVEALCDSVADLDGLPPWESLRRWLLTFSAFITAKRAFGQEMAHDTPTVLACRQAIYAAGTPLLEATQKTGIVRDDVDIDDVLRMFSGIAMNQFVRAGQFELVTGVAFDGLRHR